MKRIASLVVIALGVFAALVVLERFLPGPPWLPHAALKTALIVFSLVAIALDRGRTLATYGFRRSASAGWLRVVGAGMLLGVVATTAIVFTPAQGLRGMFEAYGPLQVIAWVWFYSSLSEEIFTRGWFQTLAATGDVPGTAPRSVIASGLLFGAMHLSLPFRGADGWTVAIIVTMTTCLGLFAARLRARSGSIWPPVVAHVAFNVGGAVAAVLLTIASLASGGAIPRP